VAPGGKEVVEVLHGAASIATVEDASSDPAARVRGAHG
jgi:hypothetical protein